MADQISIPKLIQEVKFSDQAKNPRLSLKIWLDDYDSDKGFPVSIQNIQQFELRESMFLNLPIGQFSYFDDGSQSASSATSTTAHLSTLTASMTVVCSTSDSSTCLATRT